MYISVLSPVIEKIIGETASDNRQVYIPAFQSNSATTNISTYILIK